MKEKEYLTEKGTIRYYINEFEEGRANLVFLPGLTADHRLFDKQVEYFENDYNILVWDAPGHLASRPFILDFTLEDKAIWLNEILKEEGISDPILVGQPMGGYVSQVFMELFPGKAKGFVSIDSASLKRKYVTKFDLWFMKNAGPMYQMYPWKALLRDGSKGCAQTEYGINLMRDMIDTYSDDPKYYALLAGHGYKMLAEAIEKDLDYNIDCKSILVCGEKDQAGFTKKYNERWTKEDNIPIRWIPNAGHNSNTDDPVLVNSIIEELVSSIL